MCGINTYIHAWTPSKTLHIHASYFAFLCIYYIHTCVHASLVISQDIHFIHVSCLTDITNIQQSLCWNISIHRPKKSFRRLPGNHFEAFPVPYQKLLASISANRAHALTEVFKAQCFIVRDGPPPAQKVSRRFYPRLLQSASEFVVSQTGACMRVSTYLRMYVLVCNVLELVCF